jgi:hypothetical protein
MTSLCPHGPLVRITDTVFCMAGDAENLERPRRMTVFALPDDTLAIHSGIRLQDSEMQRIDALGRVAFYLLVPNPHHDPDAAWFADRYPAARFLAPDAEAEKLRKSVRVDGTFEHDWPAVLAPVLKHHTIAGTRFTETVFFHVPSRTLVVVDLAFNLSAASLEGRAFGRFFMKLNNAYDRFGITRLTQLLVRDPRALRGSLERIMEWDFERVIVSHGDNVEADGHRVFRGGFPKYLPAT